MERGPERKGFVGGSMLFASSTLPSIGASTNAKLEAHALFDLRLGLHDDKARWRVSVWGRNVTNKRYTVGILRTVDTTQRFNGLPGYLWVTFGYDFK